MKAFSLPEFFDEANSHIFGFVTGFATVFLSVILPNAQGKLGDQVYINVVWDLIYGMGYYISYTITGRIYSGFGFLLWPIICFILITLAAMNLFSLRWLNPKLGCSLLLLATAFFNMKLSDTNKGYLSYLTFYTKESHAAF